MRNAEKPQNKSGNIASSQRYILLCSFCLNHFRMWLWERERARTVDHTAKTVNR